MSSRMTELVNRHLDLLSYKRAIELCPNFRTWPLVATQYKL